MPARRDVTDRQRKLKQPAHEGQSGQHHAELPVPDPSVSVDFPPLAPPAEFSPVQGDRWLCSELLSLCWVDVTGRKAAIMVNLEEIWREGAQVEAEEALPEGLPVCLSKDPENPVAPAFPGELRGVVTACHDSGTGFALEIAFSPGHAWEPENFPPSHGISTVELERKAAESRRHPPIAHAPGSAADCEKRASAARAVNETIEQGSLYHLASHSANR